MSAEEGGAHSDVALFAQPAGGTQRLGFVFEVEAIAGLDFDGGDALGHQGVQTGQSLLNKLIFAGFAQRADRGNDAAAGASDFFIRGPGQPHFEFVGAVTGMDEMRVAVDQAGGNPSAAAIDDLGGILDREGQAGFLAGVKDAAVLNGNDAVLDKAEPRQGRIKGRKPGVAPEAVASGWPGAVWCRFYGRHRFLAFPFRAIMYRHKENERK